MCESWLKLLRPVDRWSCAPALSTTGMRPAPSSPVNGASGLDRKRTSMGGHRLRGRGHIETVERERGGFWSLGQKSVAVCQAAREEAQREEVHGEEARREDSGHKSGPRV
jgi:hypothetical protein